MSIRKKIAELDSIYATMPKLECKGLCSESCGPIAMSEAEYARIAKRVGHEPDFLVMTCPMLKDGRCGIHDIRPMLCRLFGANEALACPFGCRPERVLTEVESRTLLAAVEV